MTQSPLVYVIDPDDGDLAQIGGQLEKNSLDFHAFDDANTFLLKLQPKRIGCVLTELRLGPTTAFQLVRQLRHRGSTLPVILLTSHATVPLAVQALKAGLLDVLEKPIEQFRLWECITRAFEIHGQERDFALHRHSVKHRISQLSRQELQVLQMLLDGEPNKRIAAQLCVSPRTIVFRRKSLMQKMNAKSVGELACLVNSVTSDITHSAMEPPTLLDVHFGTNMSDASDTLSLQNDGLVGSAIISTQATTQRRF